MPRPDIYSIEKVDNGYILVVGSNAMRKEIFSDFKSLLNRLSDYCEEGA